MGDGNASFLKFLFDGDIKKAGDHIVNNVLKPRIKQILWESGSGALRTIIYDDGGAPAKDGGPYWKGQNSKTQTGGYNPMAREWSPNQNRQPQTVQQQKPARNETALVSMSNYMYVAYYSAERAIEVRDTLRQRLEKARNTPGMFPVIAVSDMASLSKREFETSCCNYGWDDIPEVPILKYFDEDKDQQMFRVQWPEAVPIEDIRRNMYA